LIRPHNAKIDELRQLEELPEGLEWLEWLLSVNCGLAFGLDQYNDPMDMY